MEQVLATIRCGTYSKRCCIITLFESQWILPSRVALLIEETTNQAESQQIKYWFLVRGEYRSARGYPSEQSRPFRTE